MRKRKLIIRRSIIPDLEKEAILFLNSLKTKYQISVNFLFEDGIIIEYEGRSSLDLFDHTRGKDLIEITPDVTRISFYVPVQIDPVIIVFGDYSITIIDTATRIQKINYI